MAATYGSTLFKHVYARYDSEDGKVYRVIIREDLGTKTGLQADGAADGGIWKGRRRRMRHANYKGTGAGNETIKRSYPCSNQYWTQHADLQHTIEMDGVTLQLTGFSGEKTR